MSWCGVGFRIPLLWKGTVPRVWDTHQINPLSKPDAA